MRRCQVRTCVDSYRSFCSCDLIDCKAACFYVHLAVGLQGYICVQGAAAAFCSRIAKGQGTGTVAVTAYRYSIIGTGAFQQFTAAVANQCQPGIVADSDAGINSTAVTAEIQVFDAQVIIDTRRAFRGTAAYVQGASAYRTGDIGMDGTCRRQVVYSSLVVYRLILQRTGHNDRGFGISTYTAVINLSQSLTVYLAVCQSITGITNSQFTAIEQYFLVNTRNNFFTTSISFKNLIRRSFQHAFTSDNKGIIS